MATGSPATEAAPAAAATPAAEAAPVAPATPAAETAPPGGPRVTHHAPPGPPVAPAPKQSQWPEHLKSVGGWLWQWLVRPRVRLTVIGLILLLIGVFLVTSSVWTLPLVIVGALMVIIAWVGSRLDGQFVVEWGETGTQLQFRAKIKSSQKQLAPAVQPALAPQGTVAEPEPPEAEVVEGEAHTVEIDVDELKALIAAVEAEEAGVPVEPNKVAALRVPKAHRKSA